MPGKKWRSLKRPRAYEKLRSKGFSKAKAARISNATWGGKRRKGKRGKRR